ncbi:hypothetical protein [Aliamphritea hakodatensis]|uniref:hypothetical protein n=1 Tax=Aliamphritea hakodatensis TaxID=2895352 RepID=UPI0022FD7028|nr:hypothetical protein [Aliamphritea hakodatensis]
MVEKKLDGEIIIAETLNGTELQIAIPMYSNGLWLRIKTLLDNSLSAFRHA